VPVSVCIFNLRSNRPQTSKIALSLFFDSRFPVDLDQSNTPCDCAGNVGREYAIFEQGASAGNVGNEKILAQKSANPVALLLSSAMMLRHLQFPSFADNLEQAVFGVLQEEKILTKDLGGSSTTQEFVDGVIARLE
jgi:hypothetical protein